MAKLKNLALLIGGYGFGQGALFLAQTLLVSEGELARLAEFGISFYTITLALLIVDFGSTSFLAREVVVNAGEKSDHNVQLWMSYWSIVPVRLFIATVGFLLIGFGSSASDFTTYYMHFAAPALLIWAFNCTGILDGLQLSGANGASAAIPFVLSAISLALTPLFPAADAGTVLGASLAVGYAACVGLQVATLVLRGYPPRLIRPKLPAIREAFVHSGGALLTLLPGQLYFRFQLSLCSAVLPSAGTALFLYAKQVVTACAQLVGFLRRVEFPELVTGFHRSDAAPVRTIIVAQRVGTLVALVITIGIMAGGTAYYLRGPDPSSAAGLAALIFAPSIFTSAVALSFVQGLMALRLFRTAAVVMLASTATGSVVSLWLIEPLNIAGLSIADIAVNAVTITAILAILQSRRTLNRGAS